MEQPPKPHGPSSRRGPLVDLDPNGIAEELVELVRQSEPIAAPARFKGVRLDMSCGLDDRGSVLANVSVE